MQKALPLCTPIHHTARIALLALAAAFFAGCATAPKPRGPSDYLLSTNKTTQDTFQVIKDKMLQNKYEVEKENIEAGLLIFSPRSFRIDKNGKKIPVRQSVKLRHEGQSLKVRVSYKCDYSGKDQKFSSCHENDQVLSGKIERIERLLLANYRDALNVNIDRKTATEVGEISDEEQRRK
jgi:hypothetical protein